MSISASQKSGKGRKSWGSQVEGVKSESGKRSREGRKRRKKKT